MHDSIEALEEEFVQAQVNSILQGTDALLAEVFTRIKESVSDKFGWSGNYEACELLTELEEMEKTVRGQIQEGILL